jgi:hypothetical protein
MDSWTNAKTSKCVYHLSLKNNYTQMLLNTNYYINHHEKWGKDYKIFMLIMTWHAEGWQTYLHNCWQICYTMVLLNSVFFLRGSRHYKPCEHYHSPFLNVAIWLMKVHIMSMGILTIKSTNCVDMYNGNYKFLLISIILNVFLIQNKSFHPSLPCL